MSTQNTQPSGKPLHYGGTLSNKTGQLGQKPQLGSRGGASHFKSRRRLESIVRLENAGFTKPQIAAMLVISTNRLSYIMKSPDYLIVRMAITHGIVVDGEAQLSVIKAQRKEMLTQLLPPALQLLANEIQRQPITLAERKHQVALAQDLMDREGTFAKVSRTEIKPVDHFDFEETDRASRSVISAIKGVAAPSQNGSHHTKEALEAHLAFSNCETISEIDQQAALAELEAMPTDGSVN
jgi:hypothetical protein